MKAVLVLVYIVSSGVVQETKEFTSIEECLAWKKQIEYLPPLPGRVLVGSYCQQSN